MTTADTIAIWCEWMKSMPTFLSDQQKLYFLVFHKIFVISFCVPWDEKGWTLLRQTNSVPWENAGCEIPSAENKMKTFEI